MIVLFLLLQAPPPPPPGPGGTWGAAAAPQLAAWIADGVDWAVLLASWAALGNAQEPRGCHVTCKRRSSSAQRFAEDVSLPCVYM